ncbi:hypothetical protein Tco_0958869 [Tanacetum coccineum]
MDVITVFSFLNAARTMVGSATHLNPDCLYLHEFGSQEDIFTKDEKISEYTSFFSKMAIKYVADFYISDFQFTLMAMVKADRSLSCEDPLDILLPYQRSDFEDSKEVKAPKNNKKKSRSPSPVCIVSDTSSSPNNAIKVYILKCQWGCLDMAPRNRSYGYDKLRYCNDIHKARPPTWDGKNDGEASVEFPNDMLIPDSDDILIP